MDFTHFDLRPLMYLMLGILSWLYRSATADEEPDPLILNLTLFAVIGTLTYLFLPGEPEQSKGKGYATVFSLISIVLMFFQAWIYKRQVKVTENHIRDILSDIINPTLDEAVIEAETQKWTRLGKSYMSVDFYPQFYKQIYSFLNGNKSPSPRFRKKKNFLTMLPLDKFSKDGKGPEMFEVPEDQRRWYWRIYFSIFFVAWLLYLVLIYSS